MTSDHKRQPGRPKGSGAKGGVRRTIRLTDEADQAVKDEVTQTGATVSDVISDVVQQWAQNRNGEPQ